MSFVIKSSGIHATCVNVTVLHFGLLTTFLCSLSVSKGKRKKITPASSSNPGFVKTLELHSKVQII